MAQKKPNNYKDILDRYKDVRVRTGKRIEILRTDRGRKLEAFAQDAGISSKTRQWRIECGKVDPKLSELSSSAHELKVGGPASLIPGEGRLHAFVFVTLYKKPDDEMRRSVADELNWESGVTDDEIRRRVADELSWEPGVTEVFPVEGEKTGESTKNVSYREPSLIVEGRFIDTDQHGVLVLDMPIPSRRYVEHTTSLVVVRESNLWQIGYEMSEPELWAFSQRAQTAARASILAFVEVKSKRGDQQHVASMIARNPRVYSVYQVLGESDVLTLVGVSSQRELDILVEEWRCQTPIERIGTVSRKGVHMITEEHRLFNFEDVVSGCSGLAEVIKTHIKLPAEKRTLLSKSRCEKMAKSIDDLKEHIDNRLTESVALLNEWGDKIPEGIMKREVD